MGRGVYLLRRLEFSGIAVSRMSVILTRVFQAIPTATNGKLTRFIHEPQWAAHTLSGVIIVLMNNAS